MAKQPAKAPEKLKNNETLNGSNTLPALIEISPTQGVQLGEIVMAAHKTSGLSVEAWNALPETERDELLNKTVEALKAAAVLVAVPAELHDGLVEASSGAAEGVAAALQERLDETRMMVAEQVLIVSAPAGPRRRAGLGFGPVPVELRWKDLGEDPKATFEALRADPLLKIDGRYEERPADAQD